MSGIWTYPDVVVRPLYFWLVVNGQFVSAGYLDERDARGVWRELYAQKKVKDTDSARIWAGIDRDHAHNHAPVN